MFRSRPTGRCGHATLVNATGIEFGSSTVDGNLTATATTGNLTDEEAVTVSGTATFTTSADDADMILDELAVAGDVSITPMAPANATWSNGNRLWRSGRRELTATNIDRQSDRRGNAGVVLSDDKRGRCQPNP